MPNTTTVIWLSIAVAAAAVAALLIRSRQRDMLAYLGAYFLFFGFGPAVNFATGRDFYPGIVREQISQACLGIALALVGMCVVGFVIPTVRRVPAPTSLDRVDRRYHVLPGLLLALAGYATVVIAWQATAMLATNKLDRIALAGPLHYQFLLIEMMACSLYFLARVSTAGRVSYWLNFSCYLAYCFLTGERDFIFVAFSILLHVQFFRPARTLLRLGVVGGVGVLVATYLSSARAFQGGVGMTQALNQGSVLFVDTYVMSLVPGAVPFAHGWTYLNGLLGLLPDTWVADRPLLMDWLVAHFAPSSSGGYGFSLTAEAYLNFGLAGIPVVFALLAALQRLLILRAGTSHFFAYASIFFTTTWMYGFRGESATLLRSLLYGAVFYGVIRLASTPERPPRIAHRPPRLAGSPAIRRVSVEKPTV